MNNESTTNQKGQQTAATRRFSALLVGIIFVNLVSFAAQDFIVLVFYKTFGFVGQSTLSALIILMAMLAILYFYIRTLPASDIEGILA